MRKSRLYADIARTAVRDPERISQRPHKNLLDHLIRPTANLWSSWVLMRLLSAKRDM
jgi:hypothetical protein